MNSWDQQLLLKLNGQWSPWWDQVWLWITGQHHWWWFYLLIAAWIFYRLPMRRALILILTAIVLAGLNDQFINLVKHLTSRPRPCNQPALQGLLHVLKCSPQYSFFSAHAAIPFMLATLLTVAGRTKLTTAFFVILFAWSTVLAYSRIYVGMHYPSDILAGIAEGVLLGYIAGRLYRAKFSS